MSTLGTDLDDTVIDSYIKMDEMLGILEKESLFLCGRDVILRHRKQIW